MSTHTPAEENVFETRRQLEQELPAIYARVLERCRKPELATVLPAKECIAVEFRCFPKDAETARAYFWNVRVDMEAARIIYEEPFRGHYPRTAKGGR